MIKPNYFIFALLLFFFIGNIKATTYYVDSQGGNDDNSGTSISTAWNSISKINSFAFNFGDSVSFKCGDRFGLTALFYSKSNITYNSYGTGPKPVIDADGTLYTCMEVTGDNVTINGIKFVKGWNCVIGLGGAYTTIESCNIDSCRNGGNIYTSPPANHITIRNSTISYAGGSHGIYIDGTDNVLMEYDTLIGNFHDGIRIAGGADQAGTQYLTVRYCVIKYNCYAGIENSGAQYSNFYYNLIETDTNPANDHAGASGIFFNNQGVGFAPHDCNFYNNTIINHNYGWDCFALWLQPISAMVNIAFKNNIFYCPEGGQYMQYWQQSGDAVTTPSWVFTNNCYYMIGDNSHLFVKWDIGSFSTLNAWQSATGYETNGIMKDPLFTSSSNFTLQSSSPSVNAGVSVSLTQDMLGDPVVGNPDLGAYELKSPLPIELTTFSGIFINNSVRLTWSTATEVNNQGFDIERNTNSSWVKIGFIEGKGNSVIKNDYSFEDKTPVGSTIQYRLKQIDNNGNFKYYDAISVSAIPQDFSIGNYPNPFNPSTKIRYTIPSESMINLVIYNLIGERIDELKNEIQQPGTFETNWNGSGHASGIYFLSIIESPVNGSAKISKIIKMNLIK